MPSERAALFSAAPTAAGVDQVTVGTTMICTRASGVVACGSTEARLHQVDLPGPAIDVSAGLDHACAVLEDGGVRCWGRDNRGQLGGGVVPIPKVRMVESGEATTCAGDGVRTWCWGWQWGAPREIEDGHGVWLWGGHHGYCYTNSHVRCWGARLGDPDFIDVPTAVDLPGWAPTVGMGYYSQCALVDGRPWCWGLNSRIGGPGDGRLVPGNRDAVVRTPQLVAGVEQASEIAGGDGYMCAVVPAGITCWAAGQPPRLVLEGKFHGLDAGSTRACAIEGARVHCW